MAVYAIGDVQGCFDELQALLAQINYDPAGDTLCFCGDLVNRGNKSLETLRFVRGLGERAVTVLGNHDLHLIAAAHGLRQGKDKDTLDAILAAPDSESAFSLTSVATTGGFLVDSINSRNRRSTGPIKGLLASAAMAADNSAAAGPTS